MTADFSLCPKIEFLCTSKFWKKDEEHDARLLDMIEKSSDAILQIKLALDANTNAIKDLMSKK